LPGKGYLFNEHRRSVRCPGFLGARVRAGSTGAPQAGVGDAILLHPGKGFFAVGDGSDRNPRAVRRVMERFVEMLDRLPGPLPERMYEKKEAADLRESVLLAAAMMIRDLYPSDGCTFTGVLLFHTEDSGLRGLLFHAGDSLLYRIDTESGEARRLTENNFWFLGRTDRFSQVEEIPLPASSRLLLATDGLATLLPPGEANGTALGGICSRHPVEEVPDLLLERYDRPGKGLDDAAILCLDPAGRTGGGLPIILGGTGAEEERRRKTRFEGRPPEDRYRTLLPDGAHSCRDIH